MTHQYEGFELSNGDILLRRVKDNAGCLGFLVVGLLCLGWVHSRWEDASRNEARSRWENAIEEMNKIVKQPSKLAILVGDSDEKDRFYKMLYVCKDVGELERRMETEHSVPPFRDHKIEGEWKAFEEWIKNPDLLKCRGFRSEKWGVIQSVVWWDVNGTYYELKLFNTSEPNETTGFFSKVKEIPSFERAKSMKTLDWQELYRH